MGLAAAAPANANWSEVRRWFTRANKLDTEYAEPLAEFYRSFEAAGQAPTANAVSALLYAVDLAPQDDELRIDGARELLKEKRVAEAKTMFAPLAYAPHSSREGRERNMKIMSAIDATDVKTALSLIDEARQLAIAEAQKP